MALLKDFRDFALKGNVLDMAVGIIIGAAFGKIVASLVSDILTPPIAMIAGKVDFSDVVIPLGSSRIMIGKFLNTVIDFVIVAFAIFMMVSQFSRIKGYLEPAKPLEPPTKECPECLSKIPVAARRCAHCTSTVN